MADDNEEILLDMSAGLYRRIYAGFITGRRINAVSMECEAYFWRLHAVCDDFGNYHGDPALLRSGTQGRRDFSIKQTEKWVNELESAKLIVKYVSGGDSYIHVLGFEEKQPAGRNGRRIKRFPLFLESGESGGIPCIQENPGESRCSVSVSVSEDQDVSVPEDKPLPAVAGDYPPGLLRVWSAAPKRSRGRSSRDECLVPWVRHKCERIPEEVLDGLELWKRCEKWMEKDGQYQEGLHVWLKNRKWRERPPLAEGESVDQDTGLVRLAPERVLEICEGGPL